MNENNEEARRARTRLLCALKKANLTEEQLQAAIRGASLAAENWANTMEALARGIKETLDYHEIRNEADLDRAIREADEDQGQA